MMSYYISKVVELSFEDAVVKVKKELAKVGFGVLTEIDVKSTFKKKLDVDFRNYKILGACNPPFAFKALNAERMIGTMLPCNIVVQDADEPGKIEVTAIDPISSMKAIENPKVKEVAGTIQQKLKTIIESL